jgi:hypothetical protein
MNEHLTSYINPINGISLKLAVLVNVDAWLGDIRRRFDQPGPYGRDARNKLKSRQECLQIE